MGAQGVFSVLAILLAIATIAVLVITKRVRNGWLVWFAVPVVAFLWYWVIVCLYMGYYMWRINDVR
jgi:hypothetical protein